MIHGQGKGMLGEGKFLEPPYERLLTLYRWDPRGYEPSQVRGSKVSLALCSQTSTTVADSQSPV
jgi:hypothetical protein